MRATPRVEQMENRTPALGLEDIAFAVDPDSGHLYPASFSGSEIRLRVADGEAHLHPDDDTALPRARIRMLGAARALVY